MTSANSSWTYEGYYRERELSNQQSAMQYPHCDPRVLHAPGECQYCDMHPDWQELRLSWNINFTGHVQPGFQLCPSDMARGLKGAHVWGGNAPTNDLYR